MLDMVSDLSHENERLKKEFDEGKTIDHKYWEEIYDR
jgi:hypothetical protein